MAVSLIGKKLLSNNLPRIYQQVRTGYIVLLPEVDPDQIDKNPLYKGGLPDTENLTQEKCMSTLGNAILELERTVREVENEVIANKEDFDMFEHVVEPLEEKGVQMESMWGLAKVFYLTDSSKMPPENYLTIHERARKARGAKFNSRIIYNAFKKCDTSKYTEEEQRLVAKYISEGRLNGLDLGSSQRESFLNSSVDLGSEKEQFRKRVKVSSKNFRHTIHDSTVTKDFPEELLKSMVRRPEDSATGPWDITLDANVANKFLEYCPERNLRWNLWLAGRQVASQHMGLGNEYSNSVSLEKIRSLRRNIAKTLGYESFAHMSMETKMAGSLENVKKTLNDLLRTFKPVQIEELASLEDFAVDKGFEGTLELWDIPFWARRQRTFLYHWDDAEMKDFFPLERVLSGLMKITSEAFNLRFELNEKHQAWHPDIQLYNIYESESKKPVAGLYLDPYCRNGKIYVPGGTLTGIRPACRSIGPSPPLAALILNFSPPKDGKPTLLDFDQVENLFKRFGQALQHLLSSVNYSDVSGMSNIEWDAVEVVSNFMAHWATQPNVLKEISGHYSSNEALPFDNLEKSRSHLIGHQMIKEIYLANLDLELHTSREFWLTITKRVWSEHFPFKLDPKDAHPLSFTDAVCDQLSAAYFSKIWAKMLAADAFNTFITESKEPSNDVGSRFRDTFLGFGGSVDPSEVFRRFQGRDPTPEAFIKHVSS
uniref:Oligopeptidase A n=3 Tax=Lygus hesperus TaxID=30085 RepID=A0A0A9ZFU9_LYGHE